jgi:hypothetical protein
MDNLIAFTAGTPAPSEGKSTLITSESIVSAYRSSLIAMEATIGVTSTNLSPAQPTFREGNIRERLRAITRSRP